MHEKFKEILTLVALGQSKAEKLKPPNCVGFMYDATQLAAFQMFLRLG